MRGVAKSSASKRRATLGRRYATAHLHDQPAFSAIPSGSRSGKPLREAAPGSRAAAFPAVAATRNSDATGIFAAKFPGVGINQ